MTLFINNYKFIMLLKEILNAFWLQLDVANTDFSKKCYFFKFILGIDECSASPQPCSQICVDKPVGYECQCHLGYKVSSKDVHHCEDINECEQQKPCSQVCTNTRGSYHCSCVDNYILHFDKQSCRANSTVKVNLILANRLVILCTINIRLSQILYGTVSKALYF